MIRRCTHALWIRWECRMARREMHRLDELVRRFLRDGVR